MNERLPKFKGKDLLNEIEKSTAGLTYISETDASVTAVFVADAGTVDVSHFIPKGTPAEKVETRKPGEFFDRLTTEKEWFGERERNSAKTFAQLEKLLEENLADLTVFRIGSIRIDIYVVGLDADGNLAGIKTKAVET
jgi:hypothetical protein